MKMHFDEENKTCVCVWDIDDVKRHLESAYKNGALRRDLTEEEMIDALRLCAEDNVMVGEPMSDEKLGEALHDLYYFKDHAC